MTQHADSAQDGRAEITEKHDLRDRESPMPQPNRHVIGAAEEDRQTAQEPDVHDEQRIENRHAENQHRSQQ